MASSEVYQNSFDTSLNESISSDENSSANFGIPASIDSVSLSSCNQSGGGEIFIVPESDQECVDGASIV